MENENLKNVLDSMKSIDLSGFNNLSLPDINWTVDVSEISNKMRDLRDSVSEINSEQYEREIENNESLKSIVRYNEEISQYNKQLVNLNNKILKKINSLDDTLLFLNKSFMDKTDLDKKQEEEHNALLLELITIIDSKDEGKLKQFINGIAAPVGAGLIVEYFKMKLGLS